MNLKLASALVSMIVLFFGMGARAITIDAFSAAQSLLAGYGGATSVSSAVEGPGVLGGERDASLNLFSTPGATVAIGAGEDNGLLFSNVGAGASLTLRYDGTGASGLGGIDLAQGGFQDAFSLVVSMLDIPIDLRISVESTGGSSALTKRAMGEIFGRPTETLTFEFDDFIATGGNGANFSSVTAIQLDAISLYGGTDLSLGDFSTTSLNPPPPRQLFLFVTEQDTIPVPEPGTALLFCLGLIGLFGYRSGYFARRT